MIPPLQGRLRIESIEMVARDTKKFRFLVKDLKTLAGESAEGPFDFAPGQFVSIVYNETVARAYSIASLPEDDLLELIIRIIPNGAGSMIIDQGQVGSEYDFKGPFGHFALSQTPEAHLYFCGTGTGIAPLRSMILAEMKSSAPRPMTLFYGGRNQDDIAYLDEINTWCPDMPIKLGLSREEDPDQLGPWGEKCRITQFLETGKFAPTDEFYVCGNGAMVKSAIEILSGKGVAKERIFMERFN